MPVEAGQDGICPHCGVHVVFEPGEPVARNLRTIAKHAAGSNQPVGSGKPVLPELPYTSGETTFELLTVWCPKCRDASVVLRFADATTELLWPRFANRGQDLAAVDTDLLKDYQETVQVQYISPNAAAALARRCLQMLLVKQGAPPGQNLKQQIEHLQGNFPSHAASFVDSIRELGNLAAHASRDISSMEIVEVDPTEVDWMLGLLEVLFDHYYTKPTVARQRFVEIEAKVDAAKKLRQ